MIGIRIAYVPGPSAISPTSLLPRPPTGRFWLAHRPLRYSDGSPTKPLTHQTGNQNRRIAGSRSHAFYAPGPDGGFFVGGRGEQVIDSS